MVCVLPRANRLATARSSFLLTMDAMAAASSSCVTAMFLPLSGVRVRSTIALNL